MLISLLLFLNSLYLTFRDEVEIRIIDEDRFGDCWFPHGTVYDLLYLTYSAIKALEALSFWPHGILP